MSATAKYVVEKFGKAIDKIVRFMQLREVIRSDCPIRAQHGLALPPEYFDYCRVYMYTCSAEETTGCDSHAALVWCRANFLIKHAKWWARRRKVL